MIVAITAMMSEPGEYLVVYLHDGCVRILMPFKI